ncbi:hypothetical protein M5D96_000130 [Drosophila gunungcola]|uniref:Uncharacterized protein n=1 Tax=Drosophila gunungcola TaxID=103775 RepID=A0A9Q0BTC2_9MUSC|nr:hypothetical protein M5D96_000130 [Drosophila gunungcola]
MVPQESQSSTNRIPGTGTGTDAGASTGPGIFTARSTEHHHSFLQDLPPADIYFMQLVTGYAPQPLGSWPISGARK